MNGFNQFFLVVEFFCSFVMIICIWMIGIMMFLMASLVGFSGEFSATLGDLKGFLYYLLLALWLFLGGLGLIGISQLFLKLISPEKILHNPQKTLLFIVFGLASISPLIYMAIRDINSFSGFDIYSIFIFMPFIVSLHFLYLGRNCFFQDYNKNKL